MTRAAMASGVLVLALLSGIALGAHAAHAQTAVVVSIPSGSALPAGAPGYAPASVSVVIGVNNTVTWTNNDTAPHTVTPGNEPAGASWSVGSGNMNAKASYTFTFSVPGTYTYSCAYHSWMAGTVIVKPAAATSTTTTTKTSTTPEFPSALLPLILLAAVAAALLASTRLRPRVLSRSP